MEALIIRGTSTPIVTYTTVDILCLHSALVNISMDVDGTVTCQFGPVGQRQHARGAL